MTTMRYTKDHEYVAVDGDVGTVGVTDHAQKALGDIVYVELPDIGVHLETGDPSGVVESVKAASDVFAPARGDVIEVNHALEKEPGLVNTDATGKGWFYKVRLTDLSDLDALMDETAYADFLKTLD